jgi:hypothetical protein
MAPQQSRAERFRVHADECERIANSSRKLQFKAQFMDLARQWRILADQVEHMGDRSDPV